MEMGGKGPDVQEMSPLEVRGLGDWSGLGTEWKYFDSGYGCTV